MKLSVSNYQIIKQAVLEFKPGLTVLVGPSNNGKSSIVKALKAAAYTETGTTPIKHGADSYIVGVQNNEHTVIYQKKDGSTKYVVDGQTFSRFGVNTPEEVSKALNIKEVVLNGNKIQLNFWDQMDKPFLLDKSGGELFKFIVDSGENDQLSSVLKSMVYDRQQLNKEADKVQGSIKSTEDIIKSQNNYLDNNENIVEKADKLIDEKIKYDEYKELKSIITEYKEKNSDFDATSNLLYNTNNEIKKYEKLQSIDDKINVLKELNFIKDEIIKVIDNELTVSNEIKDSSDKIDIFNKLKVSELTDLTNYCNEYINIIKNLESTLKTIRLMNISTLGDNDSILVSLSSNIDIFNIKDSLNSVENDIKNQKDIILKLTENETELDRIQNLIKVCPYCGQKIGGDNKCC